MGELAGLRSDCVALKRSRIFVNRSLTVLKGGLVLEQPNTKAAYCQIGLPLQRILAKSGERSIPEAYDQWVPNFMRCSFGRSPYNRAPQTQENRASEVDLVAS